jgi:AraC family transcriptional regulator of adaptative response / DNA-3-methyladenine glycosylase II
MLLQYLKLRAIPGVEQAEGNVYRRSIALAGQHGSFEMSLDSNGATLVARIQFTDPRALFQIVERIRNMFDLNADWHAIAAQLATTVLWDSAFERLRIAAGAGTVSSWRCERSLVNR